MNLVYWIISKYTQTTTQGHNGSFGGLPHVGLGDVINDYAALGIRIGAHQIVDEAKELEDKGLISLRSGAYYFALTQNGWQVLQPN